MVSLARCDAPMVEDSKVAPLDSASSYSGPRCRVVRGRSNTRIARGFRYSVLSGRLGGGWWARWGRSRRRLRSGYLARRDAAEAVLVRSDRYVFGTGESAPLLGAYRAQLGVPSRG